MSPPPSVAVQETLISEYQPDKERSFLVSMMLFELVRGVCLSFANHLISLNAVRITSVIFWGMNSARLDANNANTYTIFSNHIGTCSALPSADVSADSPQED